MREGWSEGQHDARSGDLQSQVAVEEEEEMTSNFGKTWNIPYLLDIAAVKSSKSLC